ncbi:MAG: response regulator [Cyclobacteriaceae bacterium]
MDGLEATRQNKAFKPELAVIAITARAMHDDKQKALEAGCNDYVAKSKKKVALCKNTSGNRRQAHYCSGNG